jgi:hypothetical protein
MRIPVCGLRYRDPFQQRCAFMRHCDSLLAVLTLPVFLARHVQIKRGKRQHKYTYKVGCTSYKLPVTRCKDIASDGGSHGVSTLLQGYAITSLPCVMTISYQLCPARSSVASGHTAGRWIWTRSGDNCPTSPLVLQNTAFK